MVEFSVEACENWRGLINYIKHHTIMKPGSTTTPLRVVSNSSVNNNNSDVSYNDILAYKKVCNSKTDQFIIFLSQQLLTAVIQIEKN